MEKLDPKLYTIKFLMHAMGLYIDPKVGASSKFCQWVAMLEAGPCLLCLKMHGSVWPIEYLHFRIEKHPNCRCRYGKLPSIQSGTATTDGMNGADYTLKNYDCLPKNYVTKRQAIESGWKRHLGNLRSVLPGKTIGGVQYYNKERRVPDAPGRIWYEADINYVGGFRSTQRILYSNDGLIFVTYDHYFTFYEIV